MNRRVLTLLLCVATLVLSGTAFAQEHPEHPSAVAKTKPAAALMAGYGNWHHAVATKNAQAQAFFDQGRVQSRRSGAVLPARGRTRP